MHVLALAAISYITGIDNYTLFRVKSNSPRLEALINDIVLPVHKQESVSLATYCQNYINYSESSYEYTRRGNEKKISFLASLCPNRDLELLNFLTLFFFLTTRSRGKKSFKIPGISLIGCEIKRVRKKIQSP